MNCCVIYFWWIMYCQFYMVHQITVSWLNCLCIATNFLSFSTCKYTCKVHVRNNFYCEKCNTAGLHSQTKLAEAECLLEHYWSIHVCTLMLHSVKSLKKKKTSYHNCSVSRNVQFLVKVYNKGSHAIILSTLYSSSTEGLQQLIVQSVC